MGNYYEQLHTLYHFAVVDNIAPTPTFSDSVLGISSLETVGRSLTEWASRDRVQPPSDQGKTSRLCHCKAGLFWLSRLQWLRQSPFPPAMQGTPSLLSD